MTSRKSRTQYHKEKIEKKKKKLDRLLNILIAIVSILIVIKLFFVFTDNDETAQDKNEAKVEEKSGQEQRNKEEDIQNNDEEKKSNEDENSQETNESDKEKEVNNEEQLQSEEVVTKVENDEFVEEIIENPNWQPFPTQQSGTHVSAYEKGNIDYEEKLQAIRQAVQLEENDIIYWSVRNNGSPDTAISIISSKDKSKKYRVSIQWIENEGWKPVKVEKLKKLEGLIQK